MSDETSQSERGESTTPVTDTTGDQRSHGSAGQRTTDAGDFVGGAATSRRSVLGGLGGLAAASLTVGAASATFGGSDVPSPTVEGPIEGGSVTGGPLTAAPIDVGEYGYVEEEYFVSGEARHDDYFTDGENPDQTAEFTTRVLVYRPESSRRFNGTVHSEWLNVSTQMDAPVAWPNAYDTFMRNGTAVALVSAQKVGVDDSVLDRDLATWDPERYGDLTHPGDEYAIDIFAQVNAALGADNESSGGSAGWWGRSRGGNEDAKAHPLGDLEAGALLATGHSQSGFMLLRYINLVAPEYGLIDGFLPAGSPLTTARADLAPILWFNSEDEAEPLSASEAEERAEERPGEINIPETGLRIEEATEGPRDDEGLFTLWEVAGASHVNYWLSAWSRAQRSRDFEGGEADFDPEAAGQYGEQPDAVYGECDYNYFPARFAWRAAVEQLREWVTRGDEPPRADRIERSVDEDGSVTLERDEHGNARGGLRLPVLDVPVATYDARNCGQTGKTNRFDEEKLAELYPSHGAYVGAVRSASAKAVARGHMLRRDAEYLVERARESPIGDSASAGSPTGGNATTDNATGGETASGSFFG